MATNTRVEAYTADDLSGVQATGIGIRIELIEICHTQSQEGVGEQLDRLGFGGATDQFRNAGCTIGVLAVMLFRCGSLCQQVRKGAGSFHSRGIIHRRADDDTRRVQVVVQRMALTQELWGEDDLLIAGLLTQLRGVADRNRRLDDDPTVRVIFTDGLYGGFHARGVEVVLALVIVGGGSHNRVISTGICNGRISGGLEVQFHRAITLAIEEPRDLHIHNRAFAAVEHLHLFGHDVQRVHLVMLRQQQCHRQSHIAGTGDCDLHVHSSYFLCILIIGFFKIVLLRVDRNR